MTNDEIDRIVYACRQSGDDSTYAIVRAAIAAAVGGVGTLNSGPEPDDLSVAYFMGLHAGKRAPQPAAQALYSVRVFWQQHTQAYALSMTMAELHNDVELVIRAARGQTLRLLTQEDMDSLGRRAEGMDGNEWDKWVQEKFAQVNGLKVQGGSHE